VFVKKAACVGSYGVQDINRTKCTKCCGWSVIREKAVQEKAWRGNLKATAPGALDRSSMRLLTTSPKSTHPRRTTMPRPFPLAARRAPVPAGGGTRGAAPLLIVLQTLAPLVEVMSQRHAKLSLDPSGLVRKGKFGGIGMFDSTLEEQVVCPDAQALRGVYDEHVLSPDSQQTFSPSNKKDLVCTPEGELFFVVGKGGIDTTPGR
jgi:hypothetical protein